jgi:hypothetical protein
VTISHRPRLLGGAILSVTAYFSFRQAILSSSPGTSVPGRSYCESLCRTDETPAPGHATWLQAIQAAEGEVGEVLSRFLRDLPCLRRANAFGGQRD